MKNRISAEAFELPCPACILGRPLLPRTELRPEWPKPQQLAGAWAVSRQGFHALNRPAEDALRRLKG